MDILVLGAGAWGTALAISAGARHAVTLWARDPAQAGAIARAGENAHYLPGHRLPPAVQVVSPEQGMPASLAPRHDLVIVATPMAGLRTMLVELAACTRPVAWLCKGFEAPCSQPYGLLGHEVRAEVAPRLAGGALSGPSFAQEVAQGRPTALVAASDAAVVREALVAAFHGPTLRVYANDDLPGVEVGGAVKNVLAIATGLCDGLALGLNARAALVTRGLAEMTRLGLALGARSDTFMGLSGLGDLVLTATGDLSRNRRVGLLLAEGRSLEQAVASLGHVAEGVYSARTVVERARRLQLEMPIAEAVVDLLDGRATPQQAVASLMGRGPAAEGH
jgi:glycerol-3-phosphate dehydrogenase (NAD(P)+)